MAIGRHDEVVRTTCTVGGLRAPQHTQRLCRRCLMYDNHGIIHLLSCSSTCISVALEERYVGYRRVRRLVGLKIPPCRLFALPTSVLFQVYLTGT